MTHTKEFIKRIFDVVAERFPQAHIEYQFSERSKTHFIKITPQAISDSASFLDLEAEFNQEWFKADFQTDESFCFVSSDSLVQLDNPALIYAPEPLKLELSFDGVDLFKIEVSSIVVDERQYCVDGHNAPVHFTNSLDHLAVAA